MDRHQVPSRSPRMDFVAPLPSEKIGELGLSRLHWCLNAVEPVQEPTPGEFLLVGLAPRQAPGVLAIYVDALVSGVCFQGFNPCVVVEWRGLIRAPVLSCSVMS